MLTNTAKQLIKTIHEASVDDKGYIVLLKSTPGLLELCNLEFITIGQPSSCPVDHCYAVTSVKGNAYMESLKPVHCPISDTATPPPQKRKSTTKDSLYPFDNLEVGQSFHLPVSESSPTPELCAKRLKSATAYHNRKHAKSTNEVVQWKDGRSVPKKEYSKHFKAYAVYADDEQGEGARVYRDL